MLRSPFPTCYMILFYFLGHNFLQDIFQLTSIIFLISGKGNDVGEALVKSLQNTKYSIDEKLENSFISLFGKKHNPSPSNHAKADQTNDLVPAERDQSGFEPNSDGSDEDNDAEDLKRTHLKESNDSSDDSSEEEDNIGPEKHPGLSSSFREHVDFHDGRMRRKAIFDNDNDFDEKVSQ